MDNRHWKLSVVKQSKGRKFMSKMHQIRLAAGLGLGPWFRASRFHGPRAKQC